MALCIFSCRSATSVLSSIIKCTIALHQDTRSNCTTLAVLAQTDWVSLPIWFPVTPLTLSLLCIALYGTLCRSNMVCQSTASTQQQALGRLRWDRSGISAGQTPLCSHTPPYSHGKHVYPLQRGYVPAATRVLSSHASGEAQPTTTMPAATCRHCHTTKASPTVNRMDGRVRRNSNSHTFRQTLHQTSLFSCQHHTQQHHKLWAKVNNGCSPSHTARLLAPDTTSTTPTHPMAAALGALTLQLTSIPRRLAPAGYNDRAAA